MLGRSASVHTTEKGVVCEPVQRLAGLIGRGGISGPYSAVGSNAASSFAASGPGLTRIPGVPIMFSCDLELSWACRSVSARICDAP